jgi:hypothetical protein
VDNKTSLKLEKINSQGPAPQRKLLLKNTKKLQSLADRTGNNLETNALKKRGRKYFKGITTNTEKEP